MLADRKRMRERLSKRFQGLEGIRRRFKRSRFDSPNSEFRNDAALGSALSRYISGAVTAGELWRIIERVQQYRVIQSETTFGSGGFLPCPGTWRTLQRHCDPALTRSIYGLGL